MSTTNPLAATGRQEFRARFPWRLYVVAWAVWAAIFGGWVAVWMTARTIARSIDPSATFPNPWSSILHDWRFVLENSIGPLSLLVCTGLGILEARRASVVLDSGGLLVIDWRRKQRRVRWEEVLWLKTARWAGRSGGVMRVGMATGSVRFAYPIDRPEVLRQEIIRRADLGEPEKGWLRFTYRRSQKATAPRSGDEGNGGSGD